MTDAARDPLVSVLMPVYNGAEHLEETIESILGQTLSDFELVIVDDASSDRSWEVIERYAGLDPRIRPDRQPQNRGHRAASNRAFSLARGRYLARTDQDDLSLPARLEKQAEYLESRPTVGLLASSYYRLFPDGRRAARSAPRSHTEIRWRLLFGMPFCHSSLMIRRAVFGDTPPTYRYAPAAYDYEFCARVARFTGVAALPEPLVVYRMHAGGMSARQASRMDRSAIALSNRELRILLGRRRIERAVLDSVRRLGRASEVRAADLVAWEVGEELWSMFTRLPDVEADDLRSLRRAWVRKLFARQRIALAPALAQRVFSSSTIDADLKSALNGLLWDKPRRLAASPKRAGSEEPDREEPAF